MTPVPETNTPDGPQPKLDCSFDIFKLRRPMVAKSAKTLEAATKTCTVAENKFDGMRIWLLKNLDGSIDVLSRTLKSQLGKAPHLEDALVAVPAGSILDGEIVLFHGGKNGHLEYCGEQVPVQFPDFHDTMRVMGSAPAKAVARQEEFGVLVTAMIFDIPWWDGKELAGLTLRERRQHLANAIEIINNDHIRMSPLVDLSQENIDRVFALGGEGLMAKNLDEGSEYFPGKRTASWLKLKFVDTSDVVILDYTIGQGKHEDTFGAIVYGQYRGDDLIRRGKCSGMTDAMRVRMNENRDDYIGRVIEIAHMGVAKDGHRHPRFVTVREDKLPTDCTWD